MDLCVFQDLTEANGPGTTPPRTPMMREPGAILPRPPALERVDKLSIDDWAELPSSPAPRLRFAGGFTPLDLDGDGNGIEPISPAMRTMLLDQMEGQSLL